MIPQLSPRVEIAIRRLERLGMVYRNRVGVSD